MPTRFLVLALLLAALVTATTYIYESETEELFTDWSSAEWTRAALVHGWPWGYYAEVTEFRQLSGDYVAIIEYNEVRWQMLSQTFLLWFLLCLVLEVAVVIMMDPRKGGV